jgi:hypothetical protein
VWGGGVDGDAPSLSLPLFLSPSLTSSRTIHWSVSWTRVSAGSTGSSVFCGAATPFDLATSRMSFRLRGRGERG